MERKIPLIKKAGGPQKVSVNGGSVYAQFSGIEFSKVKAILAQVTTQGFVPEPLRVAHLIAAGVVNGESGGRA